MNVGFGEKAYYQVCCMDNSKQTYKNIDSLTIENISQFLGFDSIFSETKK